MLNYLLHTFVSTAEAVLQKMDDMKKMRRRRMMEDLGVFNGRKGVSIYSLWREAPIFFIAFALIV